MPQKQKLYWERHRIWRKGGYTFPAGQWIAEDEFGGEWFIERKAKGVYYLYHMGGYIATFSKLKTAQRTASYIHRNSM